MITDEGRMKEEIVLNHSILVGVQLRGVDNCGTVILCVLVAVTVTDKEEVMQVKQTGKALYTFIPHDSGLYLSMLSSQVSPTRSSSESDCR